MSTKNFAAVLAGAVLLMSAVAPTVAVTRQDLIGSPAPVSAAQRTISVMPGTRAVNVEGGEIVRFVVGDQAFAWDFNVAPEVTYVDLNEIAPPGLLDHRVTAYVASDPRYAAP